MSATEHPIEGTVYRIVDDDGCRKLMFQGDDGVQLSSMRLDAPDSLVHPYAHLMMQALLFNPQPRDILLIGLGGGQHAKFLRKRMPHAKIVCVEIDPKMVSIARDYFDFPADDERLSVTVADGAAYAHDRPESCDLIISDCNDEHRNIPDTLAREDYYRDCHRALRKGGVMSVNLGEHSFDDAWCEAHLHMLMRIFSGVLPVTMAGGQRIVFLLKSGLNFERRTLATRAARLEKRFGIGMPEFVTVLSPLWKEHGREADAA